MAHCENPHDYHPDLQEERLLALAQFFASTRSAIVALHDPLSGDDTWSLGCRGFARWRNLLLQKSRSGEWEWLSIINPGKKFIFSIGSVPVRFYRGSLKRPPVRTLAYNAQELTQLSFAFPGTEKQCLWRFAIETDYLGEPSAVIFAGMASNNDSEGSVICHWKIPFDTENMNIKFDAIKSDDMVELPAPMVGKNIVKKHKASDES
ncbi:hypothetical protein C8R21_1535 [Nitrosospira multiformis]|uniref:Uncharacterized protein n=1 Tax=Nitrosospira multiformis TaxID=1231 RepID=A0A2T5I0S8_9PROT|nr:hypothetical protein [Nitrosospira multiformis]PTQ77348.1 hypothetical protein C8R21_1535 [Nitrosospira multiformis]